MESEEDKWPDCGVVFTPGSRALGVSELGARGCKMVGLEEGSSAAPQYGQAALSSEMTLEHEGHLVIADLLDPLRARYE